MCHQYIEDAIVLIDRFGKWPSFHDAEVRSIELKEVNGQPVLDAVIYHFEMTNQVNQEGYYILKHHSLTTFRFFGISVLEISNFSHQNPLYDLIIDRLDYGRENILYSVYFDGSLAETFECRFQCNHIMILTSIELDGNVYDTTGFQSSPRKL